MVPAAGFVKALARRAGYRIARVDSEAELAGHLKQLLAMLEVNCVLDVGANRGQFVEMLRHEVGYRGRVVSFEPTAVAFAEISARHRHDPFWSGRNEALGSVPGEEAISVFGTDDFSSFLSPSAAGQELWSALKQVERVERVPIKRLDQVWEEVTTRGDRVFLKVDTQGRDLDVLAGLGDCLDSVAGLLTEVAVQHLYQGTPPFCTTIDTLHSLGFSMTGLFPENRDNQMRIVEMNAVLRRT